MTKCFGTVIHYKRIITNAFSALGENLHFVMSDFFITGVYCIYLDPQITLYYSDTRHTYRGQSASNYLEIPVATTNIRLTCEGAGIRWITPRSVADNINDNQWGTLTVKLLTIGEAGLYKCYGAEGISSVYIQTKGKICNVNTTRGLSRCLAGTFKCQPGIG